jgi:cation efflux family protein
MSGVNHCCEIRADVPERQRWVLRMVLWINAGMFVVEFGAGLLAHSTALLTDSVDMLGDAIVYGFSLYAVGRGVVWQARSALLKGLWEDGGPQHGVFSVAGGLRRSNIARTPPGRSVAQAPTAAARDG